MDVSIAIVEHADSFLVGRRAKGNVLGGFAEFPGGKVREGETPADAAARECLEETGVAVTVLGLRSIVEYDYPHGRTRLYFYDCAVCSTLDAPPTAPFHWQSRADLTRLKFPPANDRVLAELTMGKDEKAEGKRQKAE